MAVGTRPSKKRPSKNKQAKKAGTGGTEARPGARSGAGKAEAKGRGKSAAKKRQPAHRYAVTHDLDGPHVRLGLVWFVALVAGLAAGPLALGAVLALVSAVGALQVAKAWRRQKQRPNLLVAGLSGAALPLAAVGGGRALGLAVLVCTAASVAAAVLRPSRNGLAADAGMTVRSWLFAGGASASLLLVLHYDLGAGLALVILMVAYDAGDYVVGAGARTVVEGPLGGIAAVGVLTFSLYVINLSPFAGAGIPQYGLVFALLAPLGQLAASAVLPAAGEIASGLRRVDSVLLAGPTWAVMLASGVGQ